MILRPKSHLRQKAPPLKTPAADGTGVVVVAGTEADYAWWPAALFRSGDRDRLHAGFGLWPTASPEGGFARFRAEPNGIGSCRARSYDAEPACTDAAIG